MNEFHFKRNKILSIILVFILLFVVTLSTSRTTHAEFHDNFNEKRVLFISSYAPSFNTFYKQIDGINDVFEGYPITVDMEFMDSKRYNNEENLLNFYNNISYKISQNDYDLLMVSDDNGLSFVMDNRDELFPDLPIVFFGINNEENAILFSSDELITGVIEDISIEETIDIAVELNPLATKVIALTDNTPSGQADLIRYYECLINHPNLEFVDIDMSDYSMEEYLIEVSKIENDSIIILLSALKDKNNEVYSFDESVDLLTKNTNLPVYHLFEHGIGDGLFGGKVVSHYKQGQTAAELVLRIFNGEDISEISLVESSPNIYLFDYELLEQYGIEESQLPVDTIYLNKELTFFEQYTLYIIISIIGFVLLLITIFALLWLMRVRRQSNKNLEEANIKLSDLNDELKYASYHDYLTGLFNRNYFEKKYPLFNDVEGNVSIVLADVNGLKLINDAFGHISGDKALIEAGKLLKKVFYEAQVFRIGGDEFAAISVNITDEEILKRMKILREDAKKISIEGVQLSLSVGYASKLNNEKTMTEIFTEAEDWMYREKLHDVPSNRGEIIDTIIATINEKDIYSEKHSQRVSLASEKIAELMKLDNKVIKNIKTAGLLHDIGKIIVSSDILNKNGRLTESEYNEVKKHSEIGYRILYSVSSMRDIATFVFCHHERMDGLGYPRGLKENEIPLESKIISMADALDAMINYRQYRKKMSKEEIIKEIKENSGTQFSKDVANVVLENIDTIYKFIKE